MQNIKPAEATQTSCNDALESCARAVKAQKKAIKSQKDTIAAQDKLIVEQKREIRRERSAANEAAASGISVSAILLMLLFFGG